MVQQTPSNTDRLISHALVGMAAGAATARITGPIGFVVGFFAGIFAHEMLDAPVARAIADLA